MFIETLKISIDSLKSNKVRAFLTMLGIIIGIAAVIASLSIGQGAEDSVVSRVQGLGSDTITIIPSIGNLRSTLGTGGGLQSLSSAGSKKLDYRIVGILQNKVTFKEIGAISPENTASYDVSYRSQDENVSVSGITPDYYTVHDYQVSEGIGVTSLDNSKFNKVAVLGSTTATKLFGESDPLNKDIKIKGLTFKVIGIGLEKGNTSFDDKVYIPLNVANSFLAGTKDLSQIVIQVTDSNLVDTVSGRIQNTLLNYFKIKDSTKATFSVFTSKDILSLTQSILGIFTVLLASIAGISLIVGGIGIMNIMLVSVTERTKEIGLRKAVGAKQKAILLQFLIEAIVLTVLGGIIGVLFGGLVGFVIGKIGGIDVSLSLNSIVLAVSVAATIGIVFGFYPAYRASKLNPIDALKYE